MRWPQRRGDITRDQAESSATCAYSQAIPIRSWRGRLRRIWAFVSGHTQQRQAPSPLRTTHQAESTRAGCASPCGVLERFPVVWLSALGSRCVVRLRCLVLCVSEVSSATVGHFIDGETKIQVNENVRQTHCFVVQPVSSPVNDSLMELLLLISTLRRASAAEITAVIPY